MSGGKGGGSKTEIPKWLSEPLQRNIARGEAASHMEYQPYRGADVAAFSAPQMQAMQNTGRAASAFGLAPQGADASGQFMTAGIPQAQEFDMGGGQTMMGYSAAPLYDQALAEAKAADPRSAAIREGMYATSAQDVLAPMNAKLGEYYGGNEASGGATAPSAMQQQYQNQENYQRIVNQYTDDDNGTTNWDQVNAEYARRYG